MELKWNFIFFSFLKLINNVHNLKINEHFKYNLNYYGYFNGDIPTVNDKYCLQKWCNLTTQYFALLNWSDAITQAQEVWSS